MKYVFFAHINRVIGAVAAYREQKMISQLVHYLLVRRQI